MTEFQENAQTDGQKDGQTEGRTDRRTGLILYDPLAIGQGSKKRKKSILHTITACPTLIDIGSS